MAKKMHLWPDDRVEVGGKTFVSVTIESSDEDYRSLWFKVPAECTSILTSACDAFVVATVFTAMREASDLFVHGEVSPSLLCNLEEFQAAWHCWLPDRYTCIEINADIEREQPRITDSDKAVVSFSGGVDSCFTAYRHYRGSCGRLRRNLQTGVMIHGFDIGLDEMETFDRAAENSRKMLESLGMELITVATNFRELEDDWEEAHGAAIASCLMLFQGGYDAGLIASTEPYNNLVLPWGSNPVSDRLMSSDTFKIIHDGASFTRNDKVREILNWQKALDYLHVCWEGEPKDRNCCRCEKCIRTILNFRVLGLSAPRCFEQDVSDSQISSLRGLNSVQLAYLDEILSAARDACITESWVDALERCIEQNQCVINGKRNLWHKVRKAVAFRTRFHRLMKFGAEIKPGYTLAETVAEK